VTINNEVAALIVVPNKAT